MNDTKEGQEKSAHSNLSAKAESFVPSTSDFMKSRPSSDFKQLPSYVTSCYPFVSDTNQQPILPWSGRPRLNTNFQHAYNPQHLGSMLHRPYHNSYRPIHNDFMTQQNMQSWCQTQHQQSPILQPFYAQSTIAPTYQMGLQPNFDLNRKNNANNNSNNNNNNIQSQQSVNSSRKFNKKNKKSNRNDTKVVSVGVQNESSLFRSSPCSIDSNRSRRMKTIILMDAANQTEFSDEIANLPLSERPNAFFRQANGWTTSENDEEYTSNDEEVDVEEEEDSDSGYSSPQHRRYFLLNNPAADPNQYYPTAENHTQNIYTSCVPLLLNTGQQQTAVNMNNNNNTCLLNDEFPALSISQQTLKDNRPNSKRLKRQIMANKAAEEEYAEICVESEVLKHHAHQKQQHFSNYQKPVDISTATSIVNNSTLTMASIVARSKVVTPTTNLTTVTTSVTNNGEKFKKSKQPLTIADMLTGQLEMQHSSRSVQNKQQQQQANNHSLSVVKPINSLDSTAPLIKRGKERENPKPKKPSPLKKVILKEREERKRSRDMPDITLHEVDMDSAANSESKASSSIDFGESIGTPISADDSPVSQTSPLSMSPLSASPTPATSHVSATVLQKIHSRRFREYCTHVLDSNIDNCVTELLHELVRFQDRLYQKDPIKAKAKRRIVLGLREVTKHLKLRKIRCVIISPNLERIQSKGGLDDALNSIMQFCREQTVPFVFALGRRALGRACSKLVPVSVVGIFNHEGCDEKFRQLMSLTEQARAQYEEMVDSFEKEIQQHLLNVQRTNNSDTSNRQFPISYSVIPNASVGHSRTPSACSAISFISVADQVAPNTITNACNNDSNHQQQPQQQQHIQQPLTNKKFENNDDDNLTSSTVVRVTDTEHALDDIDEGHEADTEDDKTKNIHDWLTKQPVQIGSDTLNQ